MGGTLETSALPRKIAPQLVSEATGALDRRKSWQGEAKFDGYRLMARKEADDVALYSKGGEEWSNRFPGLVKAVRSLAVANAWLDCEACVLDDAGRPDFQRMQRSVTARTSGKVVLVAFDLLWVDENDLRGLALRDRRQMLRRMILSGKTRESARISFSEDLGSNYDAVMEAVCGMQIEGAVFKDQESVYEAGRRAPSWIKAKCRRRGLYVVVGWIDSAGESGSVGTLLLGMYKEGNLVAAGSVGTGWSKREASEMRVALSTIEIPKSQVGIQGWKADEVQKMRSGTHLVEPRVVVEVTYAEVTRDNRLRHASLRAVRPDVEPSNATGIETRT